MEATDAQALTHRTVGDIVSDNYRRAGVFREYGIDFCCGGGRTLQAACEAKGLDPSEVAQAVAAADRAAGAAHDVDVRSWAPDFLADYVVNVHHRYVRQNLPTLLAFTEKVARVHGLHHPETVEIAGLVGELAEELGAHLAEEERVLFPQIKALCAQRRDDSGGPEAPTPASEEEVRRLEHEHDHAGTLMRRIRALSHDYTPPDGACNTYRAAYAKLEEFEADLHRHVHLENNVLFPVALRLAA